MTNPATIVDTCNWVSALRPTTLFIDQQFEELVRMGGWEDGGMGRWGG